MNEILFTEIFPPRRGGSGRWFYEVYSRLPYKNTVVTDVSDEEDELDATHPSEILRIPFEMRETGAFSIKGFKNYLRLVRNLRAISSRDKIQLASAGRVVPEGWVLWIWKTFLGGPNYRVFAHGEEVNLDGRKSGGVMSSRQHRWMAKLVFRGAGEVIANSENTARLLCEQWRIAREKVRVVNPGVDTTQFYPADNTENSDTRLRWPDRFVLLTVGRLQRRKGQDNVIRAIAKLRFRIPEILYVIAGDGEDLEYLQSLVKELNVKGHVHFETSFDDEELVRLYQNCDLFVLANRQVGSDIEGFGMVLLEAASCGKPTITGISGGTSEAIEHGKTGLAIDASDVTAIEKSIIQLASDSNRRQQMGQAGRERAVTQFDWSVAAKKLTPSK